ncbi:MAG: ribosome biogenesis GTPase Der, partial [Caldiserica bacterium]
MIKVVLIGEAGVGKSTIFSLFTGRPFFPRPDVERLTRDRHYKEVEIEGKRFILVDTGGITKEEEEIDYLVLKQTEIALEEADLVLFVVDGKRGRTPITDEISRMLIEKNKDVILVINKIDHEKHKWNSFDFEKLPWKKRVLISAIHKINIDTLTDYILEKVKKERIEKDKIYTSVLLIGKQNSGKSTLFNTILKEERSIVSEKPGTTREPVEAEITYKGKRILIKDTAGIPRKLHGKDIEIFNQKHVLYELKHTEIAVLLIDLTRKISRQDKRIAHIITERIKPFIIVGNKWDIERIKEKDFEMLIKVFFPFIIKPEKIMISALTGYKVKELLDKII